MKRAFLRGAGIAVMMALSACGGESGTGNVVGNSTAAPAEQTLAVALDAADGLDTASDLAKSGGLTEVLSGIGPYTLFVPTDDAFKAMGNSANLKTADMAPQAAAFLQAHLVPGFLTVKDIDAAITANKGNKVVMKTFADGTLSFTKEGEVIVVTAADGSNARITGGETLASNGAIHRVDKVLVRQAAAATAQ